MWANREWVGRWFPAELAPGDELSAYATWCSAVEGNTTFYALPSEATVARWREQVPPEFRFVFKLPRTITHDRRLRQANGELGDFLERMAPLRPVCGPVSIQLPAGFGPEDLGVLDRFCAALSTEWSWAVEVRHLAFGAGGAAERELHDLLRRHGVDRVILDSRPVFSVPPTTPAEREAWDRKPRLSVRPVATGWEPVVRIIGASDPHVTIDHWQPWVQKVAGWLEERRRPTVFTHTPDNLLAPALARRFHAEVAALVPDLVPLPEPSSLDQLSLFSGCSSVVSAGPAMGEDGGLGDP